jgi:hypothetical protein
MTVLNTGERTSLTHARRASNLASGAVESSFLRRKPPRKSRGYFHARIPGVLPYGGAPSVGNASGLSSAAFERSRHQAAVESLLRGDCNATEEASMAISGRDGPRCAPAKRPA